MADADEKAKLRFHDLRHCTIASLAENGTSDSAIMAIAGHMSRRMLEWSSYVRMEAKREAWNRSQKALEWGV